jgi:uroporphyrin-III C-methyltransferase / precorrin-2 dehydrogenase / sirohydrochlorin ferrochelatase
MYPVVLDLRGRRCLLVGAGQIAYRKLLRLLAEGAVVTVVAPTAIEPVAQLDTEGKVTLALRPFVDADVDHCQLVLVATGDRKVDEQVKRAARSRGIWVNVADVPDLCDFYLPAVVQRGDLQFSIASGGGAPFAVRRLREMFERKIGPAWSGWIAAAKRFRQRVQTQGLSGAAANECYDRFFAATVDDKALGVRVPGEPEESGFFSPKVPGPAGTSGHVSLVGAGPGNPGLLTVEGLYRLRGADAVVYDRLAIPAIPLDLPDHVELHNVGKEPGRHPVPQEEINALLVRLARAGKRVVRLKGGDPFVFARGGEEALALGRAGIPCEVISGVTAGIAVPAAAGIPVTYRGEAVRLTFITAHEGGAPQARWDLLAQDTHATLVGYMGVSTLAEVSKALLAAGMNHATPAAVIEQGTLARQRSVRAPLAEIAKVAEGSGMKPPAIFVIGQVVAHAEELASTTPKPLWGTRIGLFDPRSELSEALQTSGADVLLAPAPLTAAARLVIGSAPLAGWIVRTKRELDTLDPERTAKSFLDGSRLWCMGSDLANIARERKWPLVGELDGSGSPSDTIRKLHETLAALPDGQPVH